MSVEADLVSTDPPSIVERIDDAAHAVAPGSVGRAQDGLPPRLNRSGVNGVHVVDVGEADARSCGVFFGSDLTLASL